MKNAPLIAIAVLVLASFAFGFWAGHFRPQLKSLAASPTHAPGSPFPRPNRPVTQGDLFREYHDDRVKVLAANPDLAAEYQSLMSQMAQQEKDVDAATITADPKVASIVAKLEAMRQHNAPAPPPVHMPAPASTSASVTPSH